MSLDQTQVSPREPAAVPGARGRRAYRDESDDIFAEEDEPPRRSRLRSVGATPPPPARRTNR